MSPAPGEMILRYRLRPLGMPIVMLGTEEFQSSEHARRWKAMLGDRVTFRTIPGTHWSFMRTGIASSAAALSAALEEGPVHAGKRPTR